MSLPRWVTSNQESIREEVAPYIGMTPSERGSLMAAACRAAVRLLRSRPDAQRALNHVDELPAGSVAALARLRAQKKERDARRTQ